MTVLDIVILAVFIGSAVYGLWRGLVVQIGAIAGIVVGILACRLFGEWGTGVVSSIMPQLSDSASTAMYINSVIANIILFVLGYSLVRILASVVKTVAHALFLGAVDRILGALFSVFQWMLVLSIVLNVWQMFASGKSVASYSTLAGGKAAAAVEGLAPTVLGFAPFPQIF